MDPGRREEVLARLTGPGGPFEIEQGLVLGERMAVFRERVPSLRQLLADSARHGDREYLVGGDRRITYAQHLRQVASLAQGLRERYGVRPGDRVAILAANCPEWILCFWATLSLGGIVAALNGWWTAEEIRYGIGNSDPKVLVADRRRLQRLGRAPPGLRLVEIESELGDLLAHAPDAELPQQPIAEDDPAVILYTSGTTERPRGALASHRGVCGFVQTSLLAGSVHAALLAPPSTAPAGPSTTLVTAPLFHFSGLYGNTVMMLATGGKLVLRSGRFNPEDVLRIIEAEEVTGWSPLGSMGPRVLDCPDLARRDVSSVRVLGFGGAPVSPTLQRRLLAAFPNAGARASMGYGSSELVATAASNRGEEYRRHPTSVGRVTPTVELEIRGPDGRALGDGEPGEIHVRSPYGMLEYWRNPEATASVLGPGRWLATGDIGWLQDGRLYIDSRAGDRILRSAENVSPVEIEHRLEAHPAVAEAVVVGVEHPVLGQEVKAVVVPVPGAEIATADLARWVRETLAPYKVPSLWQLRREPLPRNAAGKLLRSVIRGERRSAFIEE